MKLSFGLLFLVCTLPGQCAEKINISEAEPLARQVVIGSIPTHEPKTKLIIKEIQVPDLWEQMHIQIFNVQYKGFPDSQQLLYADGKFSRFVQSFGGYGLMSAVVSDKTLFYTYSWGSGIHRSHVGRFHIEESKQIRQESDAFTFQDIFIKRNSEGVLELVNGKFMSVNIWSDSKPIGHIDLSEKTRLRIIDSTGKEYKLVRPSKTKDSQQDIAPSDR